MRKRSIFVSLMLCACSLLIPGSAHAAKAKAPTLVMWGVVVDGQRQPISGARVQLTGDAATESMVANPNGGFTFTLSGPGSFVLDVEADGFESSRIRLSGPPFPAQVIELRRLRASSAEGSALESPIHELRKRRQVEESLKPFVPVPGDDFLPIADRWRIDLPHWDRYPPKPNTDSPFREGRKRNPYRQNVLKGDYPIDGKNVFLNLTAISDTFVELGRLAVPSGPSADQANSQDFFGDGELFLTPSLLILSADLFKGSTAFRPFDWRFRITPVATINYLEAQERGAVNIDVTEGTTRTDQHIGLQEAFAEAKMADISPRFDFFSARVGIQPFNSDFRGFIFLDNEPGVRLFGNWGNNRNQWNLAAFYMLEKDTNSGLNTLEERNQYVYIANYYRQDFLIPGYTATFSWHRNADRAGSRDQDGLHYNENGFLVRPAPVGDFAAHDLDIDYWGFGGDGHIGRLNLTHMTYWATGHEEHNPIAGCLPPAFDAPNCETDVNAYMAAVELSVDFDWKKYKVSLFYASGDDTPLDRDAEGFDTILDNPNFAGGQASFWQRQGFRLTQTFVGINQRLSLVNSLRTSKEQGQANFVNPGLWLFNVGADLELTPKLRMSGNLNYLRFDHTETMEFLLFQAPIRKEIGYDASVGLQYRPFLTDNMIVNAGAAVLQPGSGLKDLALDETYFSIFGGITLTY